MGSEHAVANKSLKTRLYKSYSNSYVGCDIMLYELIITDRCCHA